MPHGSGHASSSSSSGKKPSLQQLVWLGEALLPLPPAAQQTRSPLLSSPASFPFLGLLAANRTPCQKGATATLWVALAFSRPLHSTCQALAAFIWV